MDGQILDISHIERLASQKASQLHANKTAIKTRIVRLSARSTQKVVSHGNFVWPKYVPDGVTIESYRGKFDMTNNQIKEQVLEHEGIITISNKTAKSIQIEIVQLTIVQ